MAGIIIGVVSVALVLLCAFIMLIVLMQRPNANSGMGAALGGGAAEQAFGGETSNVLTRSTVYSIIAFFVISLGLNLWMISRHAGPEEDSDTPTLSGIAGEASAEEGEAAEEATDPAPAEEAPAADETEDPAPDGEVETLDMEALDEGSSNENASSSDDASAPAAGENASPQPANP